MNKRQENRLKKAIKLYPVGTEFVSLFGAIDVVEKQVDFVGRKESSHFIGEDGDVYVFAVRETRLIYSDRRWADKIKNGKFIKVK